ncbi:MAG: sigma 54-interacting transcriptional regulator [Thermoanaerobacteraceae bacterium]|nr:sigma 54-interacting transcriptional regulator [Thermoanaerobacteraceae bacterium]
MRKDIIYKEVVDICREQAVNGTIDGVDAMTLAERLCLIRSNVSFDLNRLVEEGLLEKIEGRPVRYRIAGKGMDTEDKFSSLVGYDGSLRKAVEQAKAAIVYPPHGLHTLILGQSGTGKSLLADYMHRFYVRVRGGKDIPFVKFNCADYANNPQMLMSILFGVKKGAYTGADRDRPGLVDEADRGILFLDEVHRLPPEGQEMLFSIIDHGEYRAMGESRVKKADILIICATTESIDSSLLKTFLRRIPMVINLPSLSERPLKERFELIKGFFAEESLRIKKHIGVTQDSIKALLLYRCTGNVGELKNDIQIACAKAFLQSLDRPADRIEVHTTDLTEKVRRGLKDSSIRKNELAKLLKDCGDFIIFGPDLKREYSKGDNFQDLYELIERKKEELKKRGIDEDGIEETIGVMIDEYFTRYRTDQDELEIKNLYSVVDEELIDHIKDFLDYASRALDRHFGAGILYGLAIHVSSTINRLEKGLPISNPKLDEIKQRYPDEYNVAGKIKDYVDGYTSIALPDDEVGYIAKFLISEDDRDSKVSIVVAMHGNSAASSIADVVNNLLLNEIVAGYDMSLDQRPEDALYDLTELIRQRDNGKGTLLVVDMGSLCYFGDTISQRTGINIRTIDMVSTPMVLGAAEKALRGNSLDEVYNSVFMFSPFVGRLRKNPVPEKQGGLILCCCTTGEGTAAVVKKYIERNLEIPDCVSIMPIEFEMPLINSRLESLGKSFDILAVISSFEFSKPEYPVITVDKIFNDDMLLKLQDIVDRYAGSSGLLNTLGRVIRENVDIPNVDGFIEDFNRFIKKIQGEYNIEMPINKVVGLALHMACSVERIMKSEGNLVFKGYDRERASMHQKEIKIIKSQIRPIEETYGISIPYEEAWTVAKIVFSL